MHELRTTKRLIQTQNVESLDSHPLREPLANGPKRCRNELLRRFPDGFADQKYIDWERGYKWTAHQRWQEILGQEEPRALIRRGEAMKVAARAVRIEWLKVASGARCGRFQRCEESSRPLRLEYVGPGLHLGRNANFR